MDADAGYRVFVVPAPVDEAKRPVDVEMDETARRLLHERVDALDEDRLIACASAAADGGTAPPDDGDPAVWCRQHLHDAVDGVLGSYNRYCTPLHLDNECVVITGDGVEYLPEDKTYAWMAALAESRITDPGRLRLRPRSPHFLCVGRRRRDMVRPASSTRLGRGRRRQRFAAGKSSPRLVPGRRRAQPHRGGPCPGGGPLMGMDTLFAAAPAPVDPSGRVLYPLSGEALRAVHDRVDALGSQVLMACHRLILPGIRRSRRRCATTSMKRSTWCSAVPLIGVSGSTETELGW